MHLVRDPRAAYQAWLTEDVLWIITPEERATFARLTTNDERDHFIEQFWQRRDASDVVNVGGFKAEHYRRLAYANTHFASSLPGWKSDRGRIYIVNGPPDSVDAHDVVTAGQIYEVWHYRSGQRDVKFVDACRCGEYRLETIPQR